MGTELWLVFSNLAELIMKRTPLFIAFTFLFFTPIFLFSQKKTKPSPAKTVKSAPLLSFEVLDDGDTINKVDDQNRKLGQWMISVPELRGEEGYVEYGTYKDDKKINTWHRFTTTGRPILVENYKKGKLDGEVKYYDEGKLFCVGNYLALKDGSTYDTIMVEDPVTNLETPIVVRCDVGSVRHGLWTYYDIETGSISKIVEYHVDQIIYEKTYLNAKDSVDMKRKWKSVPKITAFDEESTWYTDKNKKQVNYIDLPKRVVYRKQ